MIRASERHHTLAVGKKINCRKILIVEDDDICRKIMERFLENLDVLFDSVKNAEEAIDFFSPSLHSLIITDINMGKINGFILCEKLKDEVKLIACTASREENECMQKGFVAWMQKPFPTDLLKKLIEEHYTP